MKFEPIKTALCLCWMILFALLSVHSVAAETDGTIQFCPYKTEEEWVNSDWQGKLGDGTPIDARELKQILDDHKLWFESNQQEGKRADLNEACLKRAFLRWVNLKRANLNGAHLEGADLYEAYMGEATLREAHLQGAQLREAHLESAFLYRAHMEGADLSYAHLEQAEITSAYLERVNLSGANLEEAYLHGDLSRADLKWARLRKAIIGSSYLAEADLSYADLEQAYLVGACLVGANLGNAHLKGTNFRDANVKDANFTEADLTGANLRGATFHRTNVYGAKGIYELRKAFKESTYRDEERKLTYAIKYSERIHTRDTGGWSGWIESAFQWLLFEWSCLYGYDPWRPLHILLILIPLFAFCYMWFIVRKPAKNSIWKVWDPNQVLWGMGKRGRQQLQYEDERYFWWGLYFSVLSAFRIGWRDLSLGNWIVRMQRREYVLKATGWPRVISGAQSLISVYLLALWLLSYFARPFE